MWWGRDRLNLLLVQANNPHPGNVACGETTMQLYPPPLHTYSHTSIYIYTHVCYCLLIKFNSLITQHPLYTNGSRDNKVKINLRDVLFNIFCNNKLIRQFLYLEAKNVARFWQIIKQSSYSVKL